MRLLNTKTFELAQFVSSEQVPNYGIVSHTWARDELQFADLADLDAARIKKPASMHKVESVLQQAIEDGHEWIWMDNLCIDKSNSTELSEAINSMFRYYQEAQTCYTFLSDVSWAKNQSWESDFSLSKWFTRGWTLQEMLASKDLRFLDSSGRMLGSMRQEVLRLTAKISCVPLEILAHQKSLHSASIAQKMSWASRRQVTKAEDVAYCVLGIFNVSMPLVYGEGAERAFINGLQEQIAKMSNDQSIFAWQVPPGLPKPQHSLFAPSPKYFAGAENIVCGVPFTSHDEVDEKSFFELEKRGMRTTLPLMRTRNGRQHPDKPRFLGLLNCSYQEENGRLRGPIAIPLQERLPKAQGPTRLRDFSAIRATSIDSGQRLRTVPPRYYGQCKSMTVNLVREQPIARLIRTLSPRNRPVAALSPILLRSVRMFGRNRSSR